MCLQAQLSNGRQLGHLRAWFALILIFNFGASTWNISSLSLDHGSVDECSWKRCVEQATCSSIDGRCHCDNGLEQFATSCVPKDCLNVVCAKSEVSPCIALFSSESCDDDANCDDCDASDLCRWCVRVSGWVLAGGSWRAMPVGAGCVWRLHRPYVCHILTKIPGLHHSHSAGCKFSRSVHNLEVPRAFRCRPRGWRVSLQGHL